VRNCKENREGISEERRRRRRRKRGERLPKKSQGMTIP
jgi:hypothetical protein